MTVGRVAEVLVRLLTVVVLVASAIYLVVYLHRWEWNRAVVAALFFIAAEIALIGSMILGKLDRAASRSGAAAGTSQRRHQRSEPPEAFAWLQSERGTFVFVPVLLGAGAILSTLAHVVQRIGSASATSADEPSGLHADDLPLPEGGLVPPPGGDRLPAHRLLDRPPRQRPPRWRRSLSWVVAVAVGSLLLWGVVDWIADATQARPEPPDHGFATVIDLEIRELLGGQDVRAAGEALVVACRPRLPAGTAAHLTWTQPEGMVRLVVEPALGTTAQRRYRGCLEDATIDQIEGTLLRMVRVSVDELPPIG